MKKIKNLIITILAICLLFTSCGIFLNNSVYAASNNNKLITDGVYVGTSNKFEFNASEMLSLYTYLDSGTNDKTMNLNYIHNTKEGKIIPVYDFDGNEISKGDAWHNGIVDGTDANNILRLSSGNVSDIFDSFSKSILNDLKNDVSMDDIHIEIKIMVPEIKEHNIKPWSLTISNNEEITDEIKEKLKSISEMNKKIYEEDHKEDNNTRNQEKVSVTATVKGEAEYKLVFGDDYNFYFLETKPFNLEFKTKLTYIAEVEGKDVGYKDDKGTCVPNYDKSNPKKDADVTAIINSTTDLDILTVDGKNVGTDKDHPNEDGWYYVSSNDKKVIAKLYKFEDYNNLQDNGTVIYDKDDVANNHRGKVKVILGSIKDTEGKTLTSEENISIQWPFRIIDRQQDPENVTEDTKKVKVTVTTNLPIDKEKLPDGWAFTDGDLGKTQHQVYKEYSREDGDVSETPIFTENGRNDTVNTDVNIKWPEKKKDEAPNLGPQAGAYSVGIIVLIIGIAALAITRYRKLKK